MLLNDYARIVVAAAEAYEMKPWLGLKFWAKPILYSPRQEVRMTLYYTGANHSGARWCQVSLPESKQSRISLGGVVNSSLGGRRDLIVQIFDAGWEDLSFFNNILTSKR